MCRLWNQLPIIPRPAPPPPRPLLPLPDVSNCVDRVPLSVICVLYVLGEKTKQMDGTVDENEIVGCALIKFTRRNTLKKINIWGSFVVACRSGEISIPFSARQQGGGRCWEKISTRNFCTSSAVQFKPMKPCLTPQLQLLLLSQPNNGTTPLPFTYHSFILKTRTFDQEGRCVCACVYFGSFFVCVSPLGHETTLRLFSVLDQVFWNVTYPA